MSLKIKNFVFSLLVIAGIFFFWHTSIADISQPVNVFFTVPDNGNNGGGGGGGGGGGNPPSLPPKIVDVNIVPSFTTATITWQVTDDVGVQSVAFEYGLTENYGSNGNISGNYLVELANLSMGTRYYYRISATDTDGQVASNGGYFSTLPDPNGPPPGDIDPPVISNIQVVVGTTNATITWDTNEPADTQLNYGRTNNYGSNYFDADMVLSHSTSLLNLLPSTQYHSKIIATDAAGNSASTFDFDFRTAPDNIPPPNVSNFILTTTSDSIVLSWTNPSAVATPDFESVLVLRKIGASSVNTNDGLWVYQGTQERFVDTNVVPNTNYFYTIFSVDTSKNYSPGIFRNGSILPPPPPPPVEVCNNNIDDNNNGRIDCADAGCAAFPACQPNNPPTSTPEVCNNRVDDDGNGRIDCADAACAGFAACINNNPATAVCNNGADDDRDGNLVQKIATAAGDTEIYGLQVLRSKRLSFLVPVPWRMAPGE